MLKSEVEAWINNWYASTHKIFEYRQEFLPNEYIMILKEDELTFLVDDKSTYDLKIENRDNLIDMLSKKELVYDQEYIWKTPLELKTGGCDCGGWAIGNLHIQDCKAYKK